MSNRIQSPHALGTMLQLSRIERIHDRMSSFIYRMIQLQYKAYIIINNWPTTEYLPVSAPSFPVLSHCLPTVFTMSKPYHTVCLQISKPKFTRKMNRAIIGLKKFNTRILYLGIIALTLVEYRIFYINIWHQKSFLFVSFFA